MPPRRRTRNAVQSSSDVEDAEQVQSSDIEETQTRTQTARSVRARLPEANYAQSPNTNTDYTVESSLPRDYSVFEESIKASIADAYTLGLDLADANMTDQLHEFMDLLKSAIRLQKQVTMENSAYARFIREAKSVNVSSYTEAVPNLAHQILSGSMDNLSALMRREAPPPVAWRQEKDFVSFCESAWELSSGRGNSLPMPSIQNDQEDGDDGLEISTRVSLMCPIMHRQLVRPLRNPRCGHTYSQEGIDTLHGRSNYNIECPVAGCGSIVVMNSLVPDRKLEEILKRLEGRLFEGNSETFAEYNTQRA